LNFKRYTLKQCTTTTEIAIIADLSKNKFYFFRLPLYRFTAFSFYKVGKPLTVEGVAVTTYNRFPTDCRCKSTTLFYSVKHFFSKTFKKCFNKLIINKKKNTHFLNFGEKMQCFSVGFCRFDGF
jgi:hypothetical protein